MPNDKCPECGGPCEKLRPTIAEIEALLDSKETVSLRPDGFVYRSTAQQDAKRIDLAWKAEIAGLRDEWDKAQQRIEELEDFLRRSNEIRDDMRPVIRAADTVEKMFDKYGCGVIRSDKGIIVRKLRDALATCHKGEK